MPNKSFLTAQTLLGKSAGIICYSDLPTDYFSQLVLSAAEIVWESYRSAWTLNDLWEDGTTLWLSPEEDLIATVSKDGNLFVEENPVF